MNQDATGKFLSKAAGVSTPMSCQNVANKYFAEGDILANEFCNNAGIIGFLNRVEQRKEAEDIAPERLIKQVQNMVNRYDELYKQLNSI